MMQAFANEIKMKVADKEHPILQHRLEQGAVVCDTWVLCCERPMGAVMLQA